MSVGEFELIERYFHRALPERSDVLIGIGDDGALLEIPTEHKLVTAAATLSTADWDESGGEATILGRKLMTVAMTRLAAAGVQARWVTLALTLPEARAPWLAAFSDALFQVSAPLGAALIGGDTTRGPFTATLIVHGLLDRDEAHTTPRCRAGDGLFVSGRIDDAPAESTAASGEIPVALGQWIRACGGVAEDSSEGLGVGVQNLLRRHALGATLELSRLPVAGKPRQPQEADRDWSEVLARRNNTRLCFTLPPDAEVSTVQGEHQGGHGCWTRIGSVNSSGVVQWVTPGGRVLTPATDRQASPAT